MFLETGLTYAAASIREASGTQGWGVHCSISCLSDPLLFLVIHICSLSDFISPLENTLSVHYGGTGERAEAVSSGEET